MRTLPRTALTEKQRREYAKADFYKAVLGELNAQRGIQRKTNQKFAEEIGISGGTWSRWNNGHIDSAEFGLVIDALLRAGIKLEVSR